MDSRRSSQYCPITYRRAPHKQTTQEPSQGALREACREPLGARGFGQALARPRPLKGWAYASTLKSLNHIAPDVISISGAEASQESSRSQYSLGCGSEPNQHKCPQILRTEIPINKRRALRRRAQRVNFSMVNTIAWGLGVQGSARLRGLHWSVCGKQHNLVIGKHASGFFLPPQLCRPKRLFF